MIKNILYSSIVLFFFPMFILAQNLDDISIKKGIKTSGGINLKNTFYLGNNQLILRDPFAYYLTGNLNINLYGFDMPFSFSYSNTSKSYTQPFNRFKLAPQYKWVKLHIGNSAMDFSKYTLAGHRFNGVGVELTPGKWNISSMYGSLMKPIEYNPLINNISSVAYKRMGYGIKAGYADKGDEINAIFFAAKDDVHSLKYDVPDEADLHPQKNTTFSIQGKKTFLKYFFLQAEYALSLYNSELRTETGDIIHTSNFFDKLLGKKPNERYLDAFNTSAGFQNPLWGLVLAYERVAPDYQTLGGYYFVNDVEIYKVAPNLNLWKGKLKLSGSLGLEYNNLDNQKANDNSRTVGAANVAFSSGKAWNASLAYSNFSSYTKYKPTAYPYYVDDLDSLNFYQVTQTLNGNVNYTFGDKEKLMNTLMLSASYQTGDTKTGNLQRDFSDFSTLIFSFAEQYVPQALSWSVFISGNYCNATDLSFLYWGPGLSISKAFFKNTLNGSLSTAYNQNQMNGSLSSSLLNTSLSMQYTVKGLDEKFGKHSFQLNSGLTNHFKSSYSTESKRLYEFLTTVSYNVKF